MMTTMIRDRERVKVGGHAKALFDTKTNLLRDMGLLNPSQLPLRQCWMYGTVTAIVSSKIQLDLPAAEEKVWFAKEHVFPAKRDKEPGKLYVVYDDATIKTVTGLELPGSYFPADYYDEKSEALAHIKRLSQKPKSKASKNNRQKSKTAKPKESLSRPVSSNNKPTLNQSNDQVSTIFDICVCART